MSLRRKTLLVVGLTLAALLGVLYLVARAILLAGFARLEAQDARDDVQRVHDALAANLAALDATAGDYANWDDSYAFVAGELPAYADANLSAPSFENLRLNLIAFVDLSGRVVFGRGYDLAAGELTPLPEGLQPLLTPGSPLLEHPTEDHSLAGLAILPDGPMLLAARPILTSEYTGPSRGTLIMGRFLTASVIAGLAEVTHLQVEVRPWSGATPGEPGGGAATVRALDGQTVVAEAPLFDFNGLPVLTLRVTEPRAIYQEGRRTVNFFLLALLISGLMVGLGCWLLLERVVLRRLADLSRGVRQIGERADATLRVTLAGHDELSAVAEAINGMLAGLAAAHQAVRASEQKFRTLAETSAAAIFIAQDGQLVYTNSRAADLTGATGQGLLDLPLHTVGSAEPALTQHEVQLIGPRGRPYWLEVTAGRIEYEGQPATIATAYDITERKRAQESVQRANQQLTALVQELEQRNRENALLAQMTDLLQACPTAKESYSVVASFFEALFVGPASALYLCHPSRDHLSQVAVAGVFPAGPPHTDFGPEACWALRRGRTHRVSADQSGATCSHVAGMPPGGYLCMPVVAHSEALGVLHLQFGAAAPGAVADGQRLGELVAERLSLSLANIALREDLRHQAVRDPLTGLFNRRYMQETLEREISRAQRNHHPVGLLFVDLDHFKRFNDLHGHAAGDLVLRELGGRLRSRLRTEDIICRYGGEEFLLILPEAPLAVCLKRAEALRADIAMLTVNHHDQALGGMTISVGVAVFPEHGATGELAIRAADQALYRAKQAGRNCVRAAEAAA